MKKRLADSDTNPSEQTQHTPSPCPPPLPEQGPYHRGEGVTFHFQKQDGHFLKTREIHLLVGLFFCQRFRPKTWGIPPGPNPHAPRGGGQEEHPSVTDVRKNVRLTPSFSQDSHQATRHAKPVPLQARGLRPPFIPRGGTTNPPTYPAPRKLSPEGRPVPVTLTVPRLDPDGFSGVTISRGGGRKAAR